MTSTLATARLDLRLLRLTDVDAAHELWTDPEVRRFLWDGQVIPRERAAEVLAASEKDFAEAGFGLWGVHPRGEQTLLGFAGLRRAALLSEPELLYGLRPTWWGRGFAAEGATAVLGYGFDELGLRWIGAATDVPNHRSVQVLARLGMRQVRRAAVQGLDTVFYRLGRHEWTIRAVRREAPGPRGVKICCIASLEEAHLAVAHGASAIGLVSAMPSGPGVISEELIAAIVPAVPPAVGTFLLTSRCDPEEIVAQQCRTRVNTIQLCDWVGPPAHAELVAALPAVSVVQVIHVSGEHSVAQALEAAAAVDALLLDSGNPTAPVKALGGTGRVHNWSLSRRIVDAVPVPVYLAGGLTTENVREAVAAVQPFGLDVCSGVRENGRLAPWRLAAFFEALADGGVAND